MVSRKFINYGTLILAIGVFVVLFFLKQNDSIKSVSGLDLPLYTNKNNWVADSFGAIDYYEFSGLKKPPLPPLEALKTFQLEEGFEIELVACEPMITSPVAMDVDADGRLWVVDMPSYMPVYDKNEEETVKLERVPEGRVVVLDDTDNDGMMDVSYEFYSGLILPRAIKVLKDGILVGTPPDLWFIRDTTGDGRGDVKELVSRNYGDPNTTIVTATLPSGLLWGMDNWIHSTGDGLESYRKINGKWESRYFERLGAWGLTQDSWGRLYSGSNTRPLRTHLVPYGYSNRHPKFDLTKGVDESIAPYEPLWPAHVTGVNRGYRVGVVTRKDGTLRQYTAATSPLIYRGDNFDSSYRENAFTPEPAGNLIKRFVVDWKPDKLDVNVKFAYDGREFLTSTDERFRPVNLYNAPDGSIYVVDMYRGIIEYVRFITDHLLNYTIENGLHKANGPYGRIYRIKKEKTGDLNHPVQLSSLNPESLLEYFRHKNGWYRDQAQQILVQCSPKEIIPQLENMVLNDSEYQYARLHALWTLEGYSRSHYDSEQLINIAIKAMEIPISRIQASAIRILEPMLPSKSFDIISFLEKKDILKFPVPVQLQLMGTLGEVPGDEALDLMAQMIDNSLDSSNFIYFKEMMLTSIYQKEIQMADLLRNKYSWDSIKNKECEKLLLIIENSVQDVENTDLTHFSKYEQKLFDQGQLYYATCKECHGEKGQGIGGVGPSLAGSNWAQEDPEIVARILLQGFSGGAKERGEDISGVMPRHDYLTDETIASILTFVRNSWGNKASSVNPEQIGQTRSVVGLQKRDYWTPDNLRKIKK